MEKKNIIEKIQDKFADFIAPSFEGQPEFKGVHVKSVKGVYPLNPLKMHYLIELEDGTKWRWDSCSEHPMQPIHSPSINAGVSLGES